EKCNQRVHGVEQRLFVFLQILVVAGGQALEQRKRGPQPTDQAPGLATRAPHRAWVSLLRPQGAAPGVGGREADKAKFRGGEENEVLCETGKVNPERGDYEEKLRNPIPVANRVDAVRRDPAEAERLAKELPVNREGATRDRPRTEWEDACPIP